MKLNERKPKEIEEIYDMVNKEINKCLIAIQEKSGYYTNGQFLLYADEPKKCMDIDFKISLLENPHSVTIDKMEYYAKVNPDNCLNETIKAYQHNSWYMIYDGIHRTRANELNGNETVKTDIIVPDPKEMDK